MSEITTAPAPARVPRWSLTMAWWALFSAMFWIYVGVASAQAAGPFNTVIGLALSIVTFGVINRILARHASRTGVSVAEWSKSLFGKIGAPLASLLLGATAIYYAVFEGSIIAATFHTYWGGEITLWYLVVVAYALPLVMGGVRNWLDKLNGFLLPLYVAGLVAVVIAVTMQRGYPSGWLTTAAAAASPLPGWITSYLIYMGLWVMMMYTVDYARMGRAKDEKFQGTVTFGWVFYLCTYGINGLVGLYLLAAWRIPGTEMGVVEAFIGSLGFGGVIVIFVSQTRINTANYYLASTNLGDLFTTLTRRTAPRWVWVLVAGVIAYLFMLTNVLSYLLTALAWQGVFTTSWVAIALASIVLQRRGKLAEGVVPTVRPAAVVWVATSILGIWLTEQAAVPLLASFAPVITCLIAVTAYVGVVLAGDRRSRRIPTALSTVDV